MTRGIQQSTFGGCVAKKKWGKGADGAESFWGGVDKEHNNHHGTLQELKNELEWRFWHLFHQKNK